MKSLITAAVLFVAILAARAEDCITNINVACLNGWTFTVAGYGGTCYNVIESYTNLTCREILASSCDDGTALIFSQGTNCPSSATDVAVVTYTCNTAVYCIAASGQDHCAPGGNFTISMTGGVSSFIVRHPIKYLLFDDVVRTIWQMVEPSVWFPQAVVETNQCAG
jgi:hypothetical protein